jgi:hypothetical protein
MRFDDIASIDLISKERRARRGKRTDYNLICRLQSGATETVPVGDLMMKALREVLDAAAAKGVVVRDRTGK